MTDVGSILYRKEIVRDTKGVLKAMWEWIVYCVLGHSSAVCLCWAGDNLAW